MAKRGINAEVEKKRTEPALQARTFNLDVSTSRTGLSLKMSLPENTTISYKVLDLNGRILHEKALGTKAAGEHVADVSFASLSSGVNILLVETQQARISRKFMVPQK